MRQKGESAMLFDERALKLLDSAFEEAFRLYGGDIEKTVKAVKTQIAALDPDERLHVDGAFERMLAFRAPDLPRGPLN
jgi:hypothetical protein